MDNIICVRCKEGKSLDDFYKDASKHMGRSSKCKDCDRTLMRARYHKEGQKDRVKYRNILKKYGLTKEQYFDKLTQQNHQCEICKNPLANDLHTHIDHCHTTGQVRDLLCSNCNTALGWVENKEWLEKAFVYLDKHPVTTKAAP